MPEYFEREAVINALEETDWYHQGENMNMVQGANSAEHQAWYKEQDVYSAINAIPAADVAPVRHGKWEIKKIPIRYNLACSKCGYTMGISFDYNYCPNCGAKMDLEVYDGT